MSGSTALAVAIAAGTTVIVLGLAGAALSLRRSARELRALAAELSDHADSVLGQAEATIHRAQGELARVDDLIGSAEAISETVGSAGRLARIAFATPLIKVIAFTAGTARAGKRLRKAG